jgi:iron(III) transport system substrate-binding protein
LGTLVLPTAVVLLKGAPHAPAGQKLIDYLLSPAVERQLAQHAHMPLRTGVAVPKNMRSAHDLRAMAGMEERR